MVAKTIVGMVDQSRNVVRYKLFESLARPKQTVPLRGERPEFHEQFQETKSELLDPFWCCRKVSNSDGNGN